MTRVGQVWRRGLILAPMGALALFFAAALLRPAPGVPPETAQAFAVFPGAFCVLGLLPMPWGYLGLGMGFIVWVVAAVVPTTVLPFWAGGPVFGSITMIPLLALLSLGRDAGMRRYDRCAAKGRPIREWEWIYVGRSFAKAHPMYRISVPIWLTVLALLAIVLLWTVQWGAWSKGALYVLVLFQAVTVFAILRKWPVAYPLTFAALVPGFPLTAPLMLYWADGVRPNLIYRHRFERLVPLPSEGAA